MNTPTPRTDAAWSGSFDGEQMSAGQTARALRECSQQLETELAALRADLAAERARLDDLVADLNDACITLASAKDDCDDYALLNTGFKLTAVRDVLLQYIPNAAMKEGAK
jgi:hypothetical protein